MSDLAVENALLRGSLFLAARALKDYQDAPHCKVDVGKLQLIVPASLREKAADALERAQGLLQEPERGR